jgi:enterochelin esterase-like enzyme
MKIVASLLFCLISIVCISQDYSSFTNAVHNLQKAAGQSDKSEFEKQWKVIQSSGIPFIKEDSVAFLYRGEGTSVVWMGDFNGWGYDKLFHNKGTRIGHTDVWILKSSFPKDARLDYKILVDGHKWLLDHENPHQQWSGVGGGSPNSELRMPLWKSDPILVERPGIAHGILKRNILIASKILNYQVTYNVYLPAGYEQLGKLPAIYITDGYEYLLPELGNMVTVLDNLIADKKIEPIVAIFIDHREPVNRANNRRMEELNMSEKYLDFFSKELIPIIESNYPVKSDAAHRAILGTAMGGLTAAYFTFTRPDLFTMAGVQSPAFRARPQIYAICDSSNVSKLKVSLTSGVINDASVGTRKMKDILEKNSCEYHYRENNDGHSWGNWRNLTDDILIDFFGKK